jgi:4-oxalocrotonate tautomerase
MEERIMPWIQMKLKEKEACTPLLKKGIGSALLETMALIEGENQRPVTWITIEEVCSGQWSIGGRP